MPPANDSSVSAGRLVPERSSRLILLVFLVVTANSLVKSQLVVSDLRFLTPVDLRLRWKHDVITIYIFPRTALTG